MTKQILVIQNDADEGAGVLDTCLKEAEFTTDYHLASSEAFDPQNLLENADTYAGLVILGGAQSVNEKDIYPYLESEKEITQRFIELEKPIMGLCLGAQIIANTLGAEIYANDKKEIGWFPLKMTDPGTKDPLTNNISNGDMAFHFHGDYFLTPPNCFNLASTEITECQAFSFNKSVYGFQYHPEIDQPLHDMMCSNNKEYIEASGYAFTAITQDTEQYLDTYIQSHRKLFQAWIELL